MNNTTLIGCAATSRDSAAKEPSGSLALRCHQAALLWVTARPNRGGHAMFQHARLPVWLCVFRYLGAPMALGMLVASIAKMVTSVGDSLSSAKKLVRSWWFRDLIS